MKLHMDTSYFFNYLFLYAFYEVGFCYVFLDDHKPTIFLLQPLEACDYLLVAPCLVCGETFSRL